MKRFVFASLLVGCVQSEPDVLTYEEFKGQAVVEEETGVYILNGDEIVVGEREMEDIYLRYVETAYDAIDDGFVTSEQTLIVNVVNGQDDRWSQGTASNLTYCVSQKSFGSRYGQVVNAMSSAAGAWEAAANVNFVHASAFDDNCTSRTNVVFNVRQVNTWNYLARAFFPSTSRRGREILISSSSFGNIQPWSLTGVLRHELGHTIGFRHEHTRPDSGTCFEDNRWRALTAYDSSSVMHYPQCNGTNNGDLSLTSLDRAGAGALYP